MFHLTIFRHVEFCSAKLAGRPEKNKLQEMRKKEEGGVTELPFRQLLGGTDKNRKRPDTTFMLSVDYISYWIKKIGINAP